MTMHGSTGVHPATAGGSTANLPPAYQRRGSPWRAFLLVLLPFAGGYYLSYFYRTINAVIAEDLTRDFGLSTADLGLLTAAYFLAFGLIQLPLGVWLDRFGPRRVETVLLLIAAAGATLFALSNNLLTLIIARTFIGLGVAGALMTGLKALVLWFPKERIPVANGCYIMLGALGAVTATAPAEWLLQVAGWRGLFELLAAVTALNALLIYAIVPEPNDKVPHHNITIALSLRDIYTDRSFWRLAPLSALMTGSAWALQGLWAAPWLRDVAGLSRDAVVAHLFLMAAALSLGALLFGIAADRLRARGVSLMAIFAGLALASLAALAVLVLHLPVPLMVPWIVIASMGAATVLSFAILSETFPRTASGRANGALNLLHVGTAFTLQYAIGLVIGFWPGEDGHYPRQAYQTALAIILALQAIAFLWFIAPRPKTVPNRLAAHPVHARLKYIAAIRSQPPYAHALRIWQGRVDNARLQATNWRLAACTAMLICCVLELAIAVRVARAKAIPYFMAIGYEQVTATSAGPMTVTGTLWRKSSFRH